MIAQQDDRGTLLAIIDGGGSWGSGIDAAVFVREELEQRWEEPGALTTGVMCSDLEDALSAIPARHRDEVSGWQFSLTAILIHGAQLHWMAAGLFGLSLVRQGEQVRLFKTRMLSDDLEDSGRWGARRLRGFPHANLLTGPLVGDPKRPPATGGPIGLHEGDRIVLARERVHREILPSALADPAEAIQRAAVFAGLRPAGVAILGVHPGS
jgi:hypothetical protein